jgi:hypothetical protein
MGLTLPSTPLLRRLRLGDVGTAVCVGAVGFGLIARL